MTSASSSSHYCAYWEVVWSSGVFSDYLNENTCPGAGKCAMSGHGKPLSVPDGGLSMSAFNEMMGEIL